MLAHLFKTLVIPLLLNGWHVQKGLRDWLRLHKARWGRHGQVGIRVDARSTSKPSAWLKRVKLRVRLKVVLPDFRLFLVPVLVILSQLIVNFFCGIVQVPPHLGDFLHSLTEGQFRVGHHNFILPFAYIKHVGTEWPLGRSAVVDGPLTFRPDHYHCISVHWVLCN